jgi:Xaa-Pro aminopeptidase
MLLAPSSGQPAHLDAIHGFMRAHAIDAWVIYDFRGSNPILARLLPTPTAARRWTTRRAWLIIRPDRAPALLHSPLDAAAFADVAIEKRPYASWRGLTERLDEALAGCRTIAMEYSPRNELPAVSFADAGSVELVRERVGGGVASAGNAAPAARIVSSADLIQVAVARWGAHALDRHREASRLVAAAKDSAFELIRQRTRDNVPVNEAQVQQLILDAFARAGLETHEGPIVAVNAHSGDPHFEVSHTHPAAIERGDWVLIDLWARFPGEDHIFSDITWVGLAGGASGAMPSARHVEVFNAVARARDAALAMARASFPSAASPAATPITPLLGYHLDDAARNQIVAAGFSEFIRHRTGHSLSPGPAVHGLGANLDNLETHDTRAILPGTGFTIEPGIYTPEFGVRLEINVAINADGSGVEVTSPVQTEIVRA